VGPEAEVAEVRRGRLDRPAAQAGRVGLEEREELLPVQIIIGGLLEMLAKLANAKPVERGLDLLQ
jgi:hypothetical protein